MKANKRDQKANNIHIAIKVETVTVNKEEICKKQTKCPMR